MAVNGRWRWRQQSTSASHYDGTFRNVDQTRERPNRRGNCLSTKRAPFLHDKRKCQAMRRIIASARDAKSFVLFYMAIKTICCVRCWVWASAFRLHSNNAALVWECGMSTEFTICLFPRSTKWVDIMWIESWVYSVGVGCHRISSCCHLSQIEGADWSSAFEQQKSSRQQHFENVNDFIRLVYTLLSVEPGSAAASTSVFIWLISLSNGRGCDLNFNIFSMCPWLHSLLIAINIA